MRKIGTGLITAALVSTLFAACSSGGGSSRTIEVDYRSDEFAGAFLGYYPHSVTVTPGMTLKFHQTWTGEPHSVTLGTIADEGVKKGSPTLIQIFRDYWGGKALPGEPPPDYIETFEEKLPSLFGAEEGLNQTAALPCYVADEKSLPLDGKACTKAQQEQPEFTGRHAYYSSGFIPFEGPRGNTFEMKIADDAKEGTYFYYCNAHGAPMGGEIKIEKDADVESQAAMNRRGKAKADKDAGPVLAVLAKERTGQGTFKGTLAGSGADDSLEGVAAFANEFTPRTINAAVGEKVTWTFVGNHTVSFNVPAYTPLFVFKNSKLELNEKWDKPAGGWPGPPEGHESFAGPDQEPVAIDAGEWDGTGGFHSSGTRWADGDTYSVMFTKAGTYPYACLIHPGQIGKVVVK